MMKKQSRNDRRDYIIRILINKYRVDPERFRLLLPELTQELNNNSSSFNRNGYTSTLTEIERKRLCDLLFKIPRDQSITENQAIQALGYCATLIQDENLPDEIDRKTLLTFLHRLIGTPISKIQKITNKTIYNGETVKTVAVLRGIYLHLTWNDLLVAISISPTKFKERSKALRFVGIHKDSLTKISKQYE